MYVLYFQAVSIILAGWVFVNGDSTPRPPQLQSMHVDAYIRNRYARTVVSSRYLNPDNRSQETTFSIVLPDTAFISGFVMQVKDKQYAAFIREKAEAKRQYQQAVSQGRSAAHVAVSARDSNQFTVSVNVEPLSKITFNLTYEELLVRKHGEYEVVVNLHPGQLVADLAVNVHLNETRKITEVRTPPLRSGNKITDNDAMETNPYATIKRPRNDDMIVEVQFKPNEAEQVTLMETFENVIATNGLAGQFIIQYDVELNPYGEILINDGYFVHFFAPEDLQPIAKHVVFVLDVSGSMAGRKIVQLREAMKSILNELKEGDYFNIVKFHTDVQVLDEKYTWQDLKVPEESKLPPAVPVNQENIDKAQQIVEQMEDDSATNIYDALLVALRLTAKSPMPQPIIIFLTDGEPNVRESDTAAIIDMVTSKNTGAKRATVYALAFGEDANREFLKELALKNSGFMRLIYEASDASLQLQDFYKQISSPLLSNVQFKYADDQVTSLTKHNFDILFKGSELVVAGRVENPTEKFVTVQGVTHNGVKDFVPVIRRPEVHTEFGSLERLWGYLSIKQLLDKKYEDTTNTTTTSGDSPEELALKLSLKYSFVTPVASLVVVKPNAIEVVNVNEEIGLGAEDDISYDRPTSSGVPISAVHSLHAVFLPSPILPDPTTTEQPLSNVSQQLIAHLPWLTAILTTGENIAIGNRTYLLTNPNSSMVNARRFCQVKYLGRTGTCTLLADCKRVYPMIRSANTYSSAFFCSLDDERYAGVCCVNVY
ncbi:hypothetical protein CBL_00980 [Carabus blaptoides fortunei]